MFFNCVLLFAIFGATFAAIPKATCDIKDVSNIDPCYKNFIESTIPQLASEGIPELKIPPLDPLHIPSLLISSDSKLIRGSIEVRNTVVKGLKLTDIRTFKTILDDPTQVLIELEVFDPELEITGNYKADVEVANFKVAGDGEYTLKLKGIATIVKAGANLYKKGEDDFLQIYRVAIKPEITDFHVSVTNLLKENPSLAKMGVEMVNKFWPVFYKEVYPFVAPHVEKIAQDLVNQYFQNVPL